MNHGVGIKQKFMRFMQGRYGVDQLSNFLMWTGVIIAFLGMFIKVSFLQFLCWILIIYAYVRIFSKNTQKRYAENQRFMDKTWGIRNAFAKLKYRLKYGEQTSDPFYIYRCRKCSQKIRIPKGKGKIMITCPKCKYQFKKNSR